MCDSAAMHIASAIAAIMLLALTSAFAGMPASRVSADFPGYRLVSSTQAPADPDAWDNLSPEQRMQKRFPQPVKAGFLIGLPVLDFDDSTIGHVRKVVRKSDGKIELIVAYGGWLTWTKRLVAVPIETVAILARQINALEMTNEDFEKAPTWNDSAAQDIASEATIQIAISRR